MRLSESFGSLARSIFEKSMIIWVRASCRSYLRKVSFFRSWIKKCLNHLILWLSSIVNLKDDLKPWEFLSRETISLLLFVFVTEVQNRLVVEVFEIDVIWCSGIGEERVCWWYYFVFCGEIRKRERVRHLRLVITSSGRVLFIRWIWWKVCF